MEEKLSRFMRDAFALLLFIAAILATSGALAKKPAVASSKHKVAVSAKTCPPVSKPDEAALKEAMSHFEKGLALYAEAALEASLVEFERAYELAPSYRILYNEAQIHRGLNNFADALLNFERYLYCGGDEVPADRREEVGREIASLKPRI